RRLRPCQGVPLPGRPRGRAPTDGRAGAGRACGGRGLVVILLTMRMQLTDTQRAILDLIAGRIEAEGIPPSQTEIARAFGFSSVRAAQYHLEALEAAGAIERLPGRARGIRLLQPPPSAQRELAPAGEAPEDALRLPVLGQVAAGQPIGADIG